MLGQAVPWLGQVLTEFMLTKRAREKSRPPTLPVEEVGVVQAKEKALPKRGRGFVKKELWEGLVQALVQMTILSVKLDETRRACEELLGEVRALRGDLVQGNPCPTPSDEDARF